MPDYFSRVDPETVGRALGDYQRSFPDITGVRQALVGQTDTTVEELQDSLGIRPKSGLEHLWAFAGSTVSAGTKELVGFDPSRDTQRWRERNPGMSFASQLLGFAGPAAIPFMGQGIFGIRAIGSFKKGQQMLKGIEAMDNAFLQGAATEALRWAPFQLGRVGASVLMSPFGSSPSNVLGHVAIETPLFGAAGGAIRYLGGAKGAAIPEMARRGDHLYAEEIELAYQIPEYDLTAAIQNRLEKLLTYRKTPDGAALSEKLNPLIDHFEAMVEAETLARTAAHHGKRTYKDYVGAMVGKFEDGPSMSATRQINAWWDGVQGISPKVMRLIDDKMYPGDYAQAEALNAIKETWGKAAPENWHAFTQYVRELETTPAGRAQLMQGLERHFQKYGEDIWFAREVAFPERGGGMYVGVLRVRGTKSVEDVGLVRSLTESGPDKFFIFKTSQPQQFAPGVESLNKAAVEMYARFRPGLHWPGMPETHEQAVELLTRMSKKDPSFDPKNPDQIREVLDRKIPSRHIPILQKADSIFNSIDPGLQGMVFTGRTPKLTPGGSVDHRLAFMRWFDERVPEKARIARQESMRQLEAYGFSVKQFIAPARVQFGRTPRAVGIYMGIKSVFDAAGYEATKQLWGDFVPLVGKSTWLSERILRGADSQGGVIQLVEKAFKAPSGEEQFWRTWLEALSPEEAARRKYHPDVVAAFKALDRIDNKNILEMQLTREAAGLVDDFIPTKYHYLISRTWMGDYRLPLENEFGQVVGYASGRTSKETIEEAKTIIKLINSGEIRGKSGGELPKMKEFHEIGKPEAGKVEPQVLSVTEGLTEMERMLGVKRGAYQSDLFSLGMNIKSIDDPLVEAVVRARSKFMLEDPLRFQERVGFHGFLGQRQNQLTFKHARDRIVSNVVESKRLVAKESIMATAGDQLQKLQMEDAALMHQIVHRYNAHAGIQGQVNRAIDAGFDKLLANIFGARAASKMVHGMNELFYFATLGAFDMGFPIVNAMTPIQTVLPELAYVLSAPPERLMKYYAHGMLQHPEGGLRKFSVLDYGKIMKQGWRMLTRPSEEEAAMLERALRENVISRQFIEEVIGKDSRTARALLQGKLLDKEAGIIGNLKNAMQAPIAISEEFSRGYSFSVGWKVFREIWGRPADEAFLLAKEFAFRTNYGYSAGDRGKIITGTLGTGWGLFKNWTHNYIANMYNYSAEAARGNFRPLMLMWMGTGSVGGLVAVPGYGFASAFSEVFTNKDLTEWTYEMLGNDEAADGRPWVADYAMYGFPSVLGVSFQGRAAAPGATFVRDTQMLYNTIHVDRAQHFGAMLHAGKEMARRGMNPYTSGEFKRHLVGAFLPRTLQRWYAAGAKDGLMSLRTGNRIMPSPSGMKSVLYTLGITPLEIEKQMDAHNELYEDTQKLRERISFYGKLGAEAAERRDWATYAEIVRRAFAEQVPLDSLARSITTFESKRDNDLIERNWETYISRQIQRNRGLKYY